MSIASLLLFSCVRAVLKPGERIGHANGFKPKSLQTRNGELDLLVSEVRNPPEGVEGLYPKLLERGIRSARPLKPAIAEM